MDPVEVVKSLVAGIAVFLCPGYALLVILKLQRDFDFGGMLCAAGGLSIAVAPLALYVSTNLGTKLTPGTVILFLLVAGAVCLWDWWRRFSGWRRQATRRIDWAYLSLGIVFLMTLCARIWMVRNIAYPLWTDSYHHTLISQLIADTSKVPSSYEPYAPIDQFTYHFGFHALAVWFHWLSGVPVPRSVVLVGQIINALAVPTCYLLAWRLFQSREAALVSALIVGLVSHLPSLFVNWGRYPQLSGQVLLPVLMVLAMGALDLRAARLGRLILAGIGAAGLLLVHNRIFLFYNIFVGLVFLSSLASALRRRKPEQIKRLLVSSVVIVGVMLIVAAPWLWRFFNGFGSIVTREMASGYNSQRDSIYFAWRTEDLFDLGIRRELLILAAVGGLWGILKRESSIYLVVTWFGSISVAANCYLVGLTPLWSNGIVIILIYLPVAVLIGYLADKLARLGMEWGRKHRRMFLTLQWGTAIGLALISVRGMGYTAGLIEPQNGFVRSADLDAMEWIQQNVSQDAVFHVSAHFWTPVVVHGLDAGYWMSLLAQRQTIVPPEIYASDGSAEYIEFINQRARELLEASAPEQLWRVMTRYNVTHVYIGSRETGLRADFFLADPVHFRTLYSESGVWVFQVIR